MECKAYIAASFFKPLIEILPVYIKVKPSEIKESNYIDKFCVSPYITEGSETNTEQTEFASEVNYSTENSDDIPF